MSRIAALAVALVLFSGSAWADPHTPALHGPPPSTGEIQGNDQSHPSDSAQESQGDQRGTEKAPVVVKILTSPESDKIAADEASYAKQETANNGHLLVVTIVLAIAAVAQWIALLWQAILTKQSIRATRDALVQLERPHLRFTPGANNLRRFSDYVRDAVRGSGVVLPKVEFTFTNYGKYPAFVTSIRFSIQDFASPPLPEMATPSTLGGDPIITPSGQTIIIGAWFEVPFTAEQLADIRTGKLRIWLYGTLIYGNVVGLGDGFETAFLWHFDPIARKFMPFNEGDAKGRNRNT